MKTPLSLLERLRRPQDQEAWSCFVRLYTPLLYAWARRMNDSNEDAADLVQEVFVQLVQKLPEFQLEAGRPFRGWLWAILKNKCLELKRRRRPTPNMDVVAALAVEDHVEELSRAEYNQHLVNHALALMQQDFAPATWQACWEVTAGQRPVEEVARALGLSRNAVYVAKFRVLRRLREMLDGLIE